MGSTKQAFKNTVLVKLSQVWEELAAQIYLQMLVYKLFSQLYIVLYFLFVRGESQKNKKKHSTTNKKLKRVCVCDKEAGELQYNQCSFTWNLICMINLIYPFQQLSNMFKAKPCFSITRTQKVPNAYLSGDVQQETAAMNCWICAWTITQFSHQGVMTGFFFSTVKCHLVNTACWSDVFKPTLTDA